MSGLPYTLVSAVVGFLGGALIGAWLVGIPGISIGGILGTWIVIFLLRRNEKHDDPSTE